MPVATDTATTPPSDDPSDIETTITFFDTCFGTEWCAEVRWSYPVYVEEIEQALGPRTGCGDGVRFETSCFFEGGVEMEVRLDDDGAIREDTTPFTLRFAIDDPRWVTEEGLGVGVEASAFVDVLGPPASASRELPDGLRWQQLVTDGHAAVEVTSHSGPVETVYMEWGWDE